MIPNIRRHCAAVCNCVNIALICNTELTADVYI